MKTFILIATLLFSSLQFAYCKVYYYINEIYPVSQEAVSPLVIQAGDSVVLQSWEFDYGQEYPVDVIWTLDGIPLNSVPVNIMAVNDTGTYSYNTPLHAPQLHVVYSTTGISENNKSNIVSLLQNPVSDKIILNVTESVKLDYKLFDYSGKEVFSTNLFDVGRNEIDVAELSNGIYFLDVSNKDFYFRRKIVKE